MASETQQEAIAVLTARAKADGDSWRVKVYRRRHAGAYWEGAATLDEAEVIHFANPEVWLPKLCGGGPYFKLVAHHVTDLASAVGSAIEVLIQGEAKEPDAGLLRQSNWEGPRRLVWPDNPHKDRATIYQAGPGPATQAHVQAGPPPPMASTAAASDPRVEAVLASIVSERERLQAKARDLDDATRKLELENMRRDQEVRMKELEVRMASAKEAAPGLSHIVAAIAPIAQTFIQISNENRLAMMKLEQDRAARQDQLITGLLSRPLIDPTLAPLLERRGGGGAGDSEAMAHMVEAVGSMSRMMMDTVSMASDLGLGGGRDADPPWIKAIREVVKGVGAMMASSMQAQMGGKGGAIPTGPGPMPLDESQPQLGAGQIPGSMPGQPPGGSPPPPQVQEQAAMHGREETVVDKLEKMIRAHAPPAEVTTLFVNSLEDEALQAELTAAEGSVEKLVIKRLGAWLLVPANRAYAHTLLTHINKRGEELGLIEDGNEEDGDDEEAN